MMRNRQVDRSEDFPSEGPFSPQTVLRHELDRLVAYLCRASWHKHPEDFDVTRAEELFENVIIARDRIMTAKQARRDRRV